MIRGGADRKFAVTCRAVDVVVAAGNEVLARAARALRSAYRDAADRARYQPLPAQRSDPG